MKQHSVLIINENFADRMKIGGCLEEGGFRVDEACDGSEGVTEAQRLHPDLIILDARLVIRSGPGLYGRLRELRGLESVPVLILVTQGNLEAMPGGFEDNAIDFIAWPAESPLLSHRVQHLLRAHRSMQAPEVSKQAEARADNDGAELLATMAHELKTPLNAVLGFSEILQAEYGDSPDTTKVSDYAGYIFQSGQHMLGVIDEILRYAKNRAGHTRLQEEPSDLTEILERAITLVFPRVRRGRIRLVRQFSAVLPKMVVDPQQIGRVVINLLSNATKFTPSGGTITIKAEVLPHDGGVTVVVSDTGIGIPSGDLPRLMEPFQCAPDDVPGSEQGTGLGIPIARQSAELHGGTLQYESEPGKGTRATLTLPHSRVLREPLRRAV